MVKALNKRSTKPSRRIIQSWNKDFSGRANSPAHENITHIPKVLRFGVPRPSKLVVLLHGLVDDARSCASSCAARWAKRIPGALILVPQSPDRYCMGPGYDWLRQRGTQNTDDWEANVRELHRVAHKRIKLLKMWLKDVLTTTNLHHSNVVLVGISEGSILAAILGTHLKVRGVAVLGGVPVNIIYSAAKQKYVSGGWMRWEQLMPATSRTHFCVVNGTMDPWVDRGHVEELLKGYHVCWHWFKGMGHDFPKEWYQVTENWLRELLGSTSEALSNDGGNDV